MAAKSPLLRHYRKSANYVRGFHKLFRGIGDGAHGKCSITITTRSATSHVDIAVQDTGAGIPEKIKARVFDPFFTSKQVGKGTGQGLSLAHSVIVKKHAGQIWLESELRKGTTFFVRLPLAGSGSAQDR
jgi:two-component system, NtrC family, sensor kinase